MATFEVHWLGFPVILIDPPVIKIRGEDVVDVSPGEVSKQAFSQLIQKSSALTGSEVRFIRRFMGLTQGELAQKLDLANHSAISAWEQKGDQPAGIAPNNEKILRLLMRTQQEAPLQIINDFVNWLTTVRFVTDLKPIAVAFQKTQEMAIQAAVISENIVDWSPALPSKDPQT